MCISFGGCMYVVESTLLPVPLYAYTSSWPCTHLHGRGETNTTPTVVLLMIQWLRSMVFSLREIDYSSGRSNTWSVEAMKTIAKYEKDCEPQRYCILYHTSNAHCALSPHNGNAYRSNQYRYVSAYAGVFLGKHALLHSVYREPSFSVPSCIGRALLNECGVHRCLILRCVDL